MIKAALFIFGFVFEIYCLVSAALATAYDEKTFWIAQAIYVSTAAIACRQVANGHTYFPKTNASEAAE